MIDNSHLVMKTRQASAR